MFNPIDLHTRPSLVSVAFFAAPVIAAVILLMASTAPAVLTLPLGFTLLAIGIYHALDKALYCLPRSVARVVIQPNEIMVTQRNGMNWRGFVSPDSAQWGPLLLLRLCHDDNKRHTLLLAHQGNVSRTDARRLRVMLRFAKLPVSANSIVEEP